MKNFIIIFKSRFLAEKKIIIFSFFISMLISFANGQSIPATASQYDFYEHMIGYNSPDELATLFFNAALKKDSLTKYYSPIEVFMYLIENSEVKDKEKAYQETYFLFRKFEESRREYITALLDHFYAEKMDSSNTVIDTIEYKIEDIPGQNGRFKSADIKIRFTSNQSKYSIQLDDCGQIKGKWFIMTPFILWLGKQEE